jgi:DNA-binding NtrC family response regulator
MTDTKRHLLLVDDEETLRSVVAERLVDEGFEVVQASDGEAALKALDGFAFDVIVSDLRLPGVDGRQVIDAALTRYPGIVAIVVTGYGTVKDAVDTIKRGAADFIAKPFQFDELMHVLTSALEQKRLKSENAYLHQQLDERFGLGSMVGKSAPMRALFQLIETVAPTSATILISGETGTGKEMVARAIHQTSPRQRGRFVAINVSAIPETLLDAELFGHARGAFTGAVAMRQGRLEQADGGTLFLDEVGTMPMPLQMKMLRVLQEREFERIGDTRTIKVDVRVVAATNADLVKMVKEGSFREDLYYRLNVIAVHLAPLRDRPEDIPVMVQKFIEKFAAGRPLTVAQEGMRRLMAFSWPGNVRQLENAIERAIAMLGTRTQIEVGDLPPDLQSVVDDGEKPGLDLPAQGLDLPALVARIEKDMITRALGRTDNNKGAAARLLGLKRTTLVEKLKRL